MTRITLRNLFTEVRNLSAEPRLKTQGKINLAEPAEPFPTHFIQTGKYMINWKKSFIGRFRRFRRNTFRQDVWEKVPQVPLRANPRAGKGGTAWS
jgi:hypothetical protein